MKDEVIFFENNLIRIVRTKTLKNHKERIMVVSKRHVAEVSKEFELHALEVLEDTCKQVFNYTPKIVVMENTFATIKDHWHKVCTDLDPNSEDLKQILETKWLKVIENEQYSSER